MRFVASLLMWCGCCFWVIKKHVVAGFFVVGLLVGECKETGGCLL